jgi:hypothetical protein
MNNQNIISNKFDLFWTTLFSYITNYELQILGLTPKNISFLFFKATGFVFTSTATPSPSTSGRTPTPPTCFTPDGATRRSRSCTRQSRTSARSLNGRPISGKRIPRLPLSRLSATGRRWVVATVCTAQHGHSRIDCPARKARMNVAAYNEDLSLIK